MLFRGKLLILVAAFASVAPCIPLKAQDLREALGDYIHQSIPDLPKKDPLSIAAWAKLHPGEALDAPLMGRDEEDWDQRQLEGRWCLRSTAVVDLAVGVRVRRIAVFFSPQVTDIYDGRLPPLPTETGDTLRRHGCRLGIILFAFTVDDPAKLIEALAVFLPGKPEDKPREPLWDDNPDLWKPLEPSDGTYRISVRNPKRPQPTGEPSVLLSWSAQSNDYGPPSRETINPEAGQPSVDLRAAKLARLPQAPTLAMLSFLTPTVGDPNEQPDFHCRRKLVPVLRKWMALAARLPPERHAAALLLADAVADGLSDCLEFADQEPPPGIAADETADNLRADLNRLGIETRTSARPGPEQYAGNLPEKALKLAPTGPVNELARIVVLDARPRWNQITELDDTDTIREGEEFLARFPNDEWTPSVHLILAEAYSYSADTEDESYSPAPDPSKNSLLQKVLAHYRAWYQTASNNRDRALVWKEIWEIQAGMRPWLLLPDETR